MSYRKTLEALKAYAPKRLIADVFSNGVDCCALGACHEGLRASDELPFKEFKEVRSLAEAELGLTFDQRETLMLENDAFVGTEEARYAHVLAFLELEVAKEAL